MGTLNMRMHVLALILQGSTAKPLDVDYSGNAETSKSKVNSKMLKIWCVITWVSYVEISAI